MFDNVQLKILIIIVFHQLIFQSFSVAVATLSNLNIVKHSLHVCLLILIFCYLLLREGEGGGKETAQEDQRQKDCVH